MDDQPPRGAYVKITEAAALLNVSVDTIRRRLRRGDLRGERLRTRQGDTWHVWLDGDIAESDAPADPAAQGDWRRGLSDLVLLVARLQAENRELATRVGYLEAELRHAREHLRSLEADRDSRPMVTRQPRRSRHGG